MAVRDVSFVFLSGVFTMIASYIMERDKMNDDLKAKTKKERTCIDWIQPIHIGFRPDMAKEGNGIILILVSECFSIQV